MYLSGFMNLASALQKTGGGGFLRQAAVHFVTSAWVPLVVESSFSPEATSRFPDDLRAWVTPKGACLGTLV